MTAPLKSSIQAIATAASLGAHAWRTQIAPRATAHRRALALCLGGLAVVSGATAFAVANIASTSAPVMVNAVLEPVTPGVALVGVSAAADLTLYRSDTVRGNDSAEALLARLGLVDPDAARFLRTDPLARAHLLGRAGRAVTAEGSPGRGLLKLSARWIGDDERQFKRLVLERTATGFSSTLADAPLEATQRLGSGVIRSSLFAATDEARIPDVVAMQIAEIFASDVDFHRALRKGDRFSVVYEALEADGEVLRAGRVVSAEFVNNGKALSALWFQETGAPKGGYYTLDGSSLRKAYLASPLEFSRVTSGFKMRFHPIARTWRAHLGVDYAAPTGTPIRTIVDGVVETAGWQNGYGNVVSIKHRNEHVTLYAHMSKMNVRKGQTVAQGDTIGLVGATGWATGPHLHFEFRVNGAHQDPLTIARQNESIPVSASALRAFRAYAAEHRLALSAAATSSVASAQ